MRYLNNIKNFISEFIYKTSFLGWGRNRHHTETQANTQHKIWFGLIHEGSALLNCPFQSKTRETAEARANSEQWDNIDHRGGEYCSRNTCYDGNHLSFGTKRSFEDEMRWDSRIISLKSFCALGVKIPGKLLTEYVMKSWRSRHGSQELVRYRSRHTERW